MDIVKARIAAPGAEDFASGLLRRWIRCSEARCILKGQHRRRQKVRVAGPGKFHAADEQVIRAGGEVMGNEVLRSEAGLLAV